MNKIKNMREAAEAKMKQANLAAELLPKGLSIAKDIVSQCGEIVTNTLSLTEFIGSLPAVDLKSIKEVNQNLRDISSNTKELINSLKEILNELKSAFGDENKGKDRMSKIEKGIYRIDCVVQESCDVVDVTIEIVELVGSVCEKLEQGNNEGSWDEVIVGIKEKSSKLVKEAKEMKDAFLGKDKDDDDEEKNNNGTSTVEETEVKSKTQDVKVTKTVVDESEETESCWSKIFCCCKD